VWLRLFGCDADEAKLAERLAGHGHALATSWWLLGSKVGAMLIKILLVLTGAHGGNLLKIKK
jgi:hypothetical protein